jgi:hypothetical protein
MVKSFTNLNGKPCIYANSGTWEDKKSRDKNNVIDQDTTTMDFVIISPVKSNKKKLQVGLYQYRYGKHLMANKKEIDL